MSLERKRGGGGRLKSGEERAKVGAGEVAPEQGRGAEDEAGSEDVAEVGINVEVIC